MAASGDRFAIEHHLDRTALFVSCRSSEWFDDVEQKAFEELADAVTQNSAVEEPVTVFNATFAALVGGRRSGTMADGSQPDIAALAAILNSDADHMRASGGPIAVTRVFTIAASKRHAGRRAKSPGAKSAAKSPRKKAK